MGVPSLYKWLTMRFPSILAHLKKDFDYNVDNLYLDFNAIIHPCCNKNLNNLKEIDADLYAKLEKYIDTLMAYCKPKRMIYISVDGVAPKAKLNQQRSRRFTSAKETYNSNTIYADPKETCDNPNVNVAFDTNSITPGTDFMARLDDYMNQLIKFKMSTDSAWKNKTVIYSNYKVPGEGEQKIMEYMRMHKMGQKETHVIFSPDADLIFLGLTTPALNLRIMREDVQYRRNQDDQENEDDFMRKKFVMINEQKLKMLIIERLQNEINIPSDGDRLLSDFVFLCFCIGNDFLPCSPGFEIRTNAIEKIAKFLIQTHMLCRDYITHPDGSVNYWVLRKFFAEGLKDEDENLIEKRRNLESSRLRMGEEFDPEKEFKLNREEGKLKYYIEKMGISSEEDLKVACKEYVKGMVWIYKYYFQGCPSWDYYFPYYFAPFMCDLHALKVEQLEFEDSKPLAPFEQLLSVLPAYSMHLLPREYRKFYYDHGYIKIHEKYQDWIQDAGQRGYIHEYNTVYGRLGQKKEDCAGLEVKDIFTFSDLKFRVDDFQKVMDWQYISILPFIKSSEVTDFTTDKRIKLGYEDLERNTAGMSLLYSNKTGLLGEYDSVLKKTNENMQEDEYCGKVYAPMKVSRVGEDVGGYFNYKCAVVVFAFDQGYRKKVIPGDAE
ncbi:XRN4 [Enterospora canceri]|uniref:XRN4 n=1 Tax=Enterospora canceri TaxID=1081671 RepID=A0A1Y1S9A8_9MICR|nr:XRN4 [Enterospora canceri]